MATRRFPTILEWDAEDPRLGDARAEPESPLHVWGHGGRGAGAHPGGDHRVPRSGPEGRAVIPDRRSRAPDRRTSGRHPLTRLPQDLRRIHAAFVGDEVRVEDDTLAFAEAEHSGTDRLDRAGSVGAGRERVVPKAVAHAFMSGPQSELTRSANSLSRLGNSARVSRADKFRSTSIRQSGASCRPTSSCTDRPALIAPDRPTRDGQRAIRHCR
jgi:hypothetical protein